MKIKIYSADPDFAPPKAKKGGPSLLCSELGKEVDFSADAVDIVYLDRSGLKSEAFRAYLKSLKKARRGAVWGVLDGEGQVEDPAALFHEGASDYLRSALVLKAIDSARMKRVLEFGMGSPQAEAHAFESIPEAVDAEFPGWKALKQGEEMEFYFLIAAPSDPAFIKSKIGETRFKAFRERFASFLSMVFAEADARPWIQNEDALLLLLPPRKKCACSCVIACLRTLAMAPVTGYETFALEIPLSFRFALHRGKTPYYPPGKTGTLVSDDVNFIHHLGYKRAEADRLSLTLAASGAIPRELADLFVPAGKFEGREILHSRRFLRA
jgi:hypothetical protein